MKKIDMVAIGTIAMVACLLLCTPALANYNFDGYPVVTRASGIVNGGVFIGSVPWADATTLTGNFNVPNGNVIWARLYAGIWGGDPTFEGWVNVTFNGVNDTNGLGPINLRGQNDTNANVWCSGSGKHWMYYNVTNLVNAGAVNTATTTKINETVVGFDGRVYGIVLVVVYEGGDDPKDIQYWINDGSDGLNYVTPNNDGTTDFAGSVTGSVTDAELTMVHLTAYKPTCANCLQFNGAALDTSMVTSNNFELNSWDVASHVESSGNDAWFSRGEDGYVNVCNAILTLELPDLVVTEVNAYHYDTGTPAWFNILNEIDVTVKNNGSGSAGASNVSLYIDGVFFCKLPVPGLGPGAEHTETFTSWKPIGVDCLQPPCVFGWSYQNYSLKGVADCDGNVAEWNETNNETTVVEKVCYNGYMADEPLENVAQGNIHGHILFTTGEGSYGCLNSPDDTRATNYEITLPASATVEHAQLNVYYTWVSPDHECPEMEVSITNATATYVLSLEKAYNDIKCTCPGAMYVTSWGNYVFDITDYVTGSGTYTVTVKNVGLSGHSFCLAAPGIVLVYADESAPLIDYWVNKGADLLIGGRRNAGGYLSLEECINNATFPASTTTGEVATVTLGVVAPWGDSAADDVLYFNGVELGRGVYNGHSVPYSEEIDSISMVVGASNAQVGVDVTDVTAQYLKGSANVAGQGDDGDNMMPANAFLVVAYVEKEEPDLNVSEITVNYDASSLGGRAVGPEPGQGVYTECNNLSAVIGECNGVDVLASFDVTFKVDENTLCTVRVPGLTGGSTETVYCDCSWYPYAGDAFAINVTVDSNHEIAESDETDNTKWNNGTVISNGYKGNGWQGPDRNLINEQCHEQDTINLIYSVGDSEYVSGSTHWTEYTGSWTTDDLPVPMGATIEKAMLYVYYTWDTDTVMPDNVSLEFNGNNIDLARHYSDRKGFGSSNYPAGMLIYDVRSYVTVTGTNNAILTKAVAADVVSMRGMLLMVVYKHQDEPERIICIDEGYDMLYAKKSYAVTSEEATTYAPFTCYEPVPVEGLGKATLIAVAPSAKDGDDKNRLSFNDGLWNGIWDHYEANTQLGIAVADVLAYIKQTENRANFQSHIPAGGDKGDYLDASNAFLILEKGPKPDLNVSEITVNYDASSLEGRAVGPIPGQGVYTECNNLSAVIGECNGVDVLASFDVTFKVDGATLCTVQVLGLTAGSTKTVYCDCSWYPYAGNAFAINVTVDSNKDISESDETNNTKWNNGTVISNGYKGNGWQGPDMNLINEQCHDLDTINLIYSVGDSEYVSGSTHWTEYTANWTTNDLPVPDGATIEKAMLYVYYTWDTDTVMPDNVSLEFNGNNIDLARDYSDRKGFGSSNYPAGMLIYDVLNDFTAVGTNNAILTKAVAADVVSMRGMLLMVVYNHQDEPERIICIDEGYDMLYAKKSYAVTSEEATTYAPFTCCESVPVEEIGKATLIAVAPSAKDGDDKNRLSFNDGLWKGIWDHYEADTQLGIAEAEVLAYLKATENRANFQSHIPAGGDKGDYLDASNAFLILEKKGEIPCPADYAVYQANVRDPEKPLNKLRALRDNKLDDGYVDRYYDNSPALTLVLSRADPDLVKEGAQLLSRYSLPVGLHVQGLDVGTPITKRDVEEALSFTERLKSEVMKNRDAIGDKSTEAIIVFIDEFEGQVNASEGKTFSEALKSSIYYEDERSRVYQEIAKK